ncbi:MAG: hypothetical protein WD558_00230 [Pseudomonadales bacterium]
MMFLRYTLGSYLPTLAAMLMTVSIACSIRAEELQIDVVAE